MNRENRNAQAKVTPPKTYSQKLEERIEVLKQHFVITNKLTQQLVFIDSLQKIHVDNVEIQLDLDRRVREIGHQMHILNANTTTQLSALRRRCYR